MQSPKRPINRGSTVLPAYFADLLCCDKPKRNTKVYNSSFKWNYEMRKKIIPNSEYEKLKTLMQSQKERETVQVNSHIIISVHFHYSKLRIRLLKRLLARKLYYYTCMWIGNIFHTIIYFLHDMWPNSH